MNIIEKSYCRIFQAGFRFAMPALPYREPGLYESIKDLPVIMKREKCSSVLIVTDKGICRSGAIDKIISALAPAGLNIALYDGTKANPTIDNIEEGLAVYKKNRCDSLIAVGGGSSLDCAKGIGARVAYPEKSIRQMTGLLKVWRHLPLLIAVPTTSGTGSEVTVTAVITDVENRHKCTMNNFTFIPEYAILDAGMTVTLPPSLTATTGMDALTHAVEAYIGRSSTRETRRLAQDAVRLIFRNLPEAYRNGGNVESRRNMLKAAYKAGIAFSKSYVGYIHAVAHTLGGRYNIPHGLANAVLLPYFLEFYGSAVHRQLHELAIEAGICDGNESDAEGAGKFIKAVREMNRIMQIPEKFDSIKEEDIPGMAAYAAAEANPLYPVPVLLNAAELEHFYYMVMKTE